MSPCASSKIRSKSKRQGSPFFGKRPAHTGGGSESGRQSAHIRRCRALRAWVRTTSRFAYGDSDSCLDGMGYRPAESRRPLPSLRVAKRGVGSGGQRQSAEIFLANAVVCAVSSYPGFACAMSSCSDHRDRSDRTISTFNEQKLGSIALIR